MLFVCSGTEAVYILTENDPRLVSAMAFIERKKVQPKGRSSVKYNAKQKRAAITSTTYAISPVEKHLFASVL